MIEVLLWDSSIDGMGCRGEGNLGLGGGEGIVWCIELPLDNVIGVVTFSVLV